MCIYIYLCALFIYTFALFYIRAFELFASQNLNSNLLLGIGFTLLQMAPGRCFFVGARSLAGRPTGARCATPRARQAVGRQIYFKSLKFTQHFSIQIGFLFLSTIIIGNNNKRARSTCSYFISGARYHTGRRGARQPAATGRAQWPARAQDKQIRPSRWASSLALLGRLLNRKH